MREPFWSASSFRSLVIWSNKTRGLRARNPNGSAKCLDSNVPYEEWLAVIACGENRFPEPTWNLLKSLARQHHDDGVRYNAIMILIDAGQLKKTEVKELAAYEQNPEVLEILDGRVP
jgi:HEAT repeat protein